MFDKLIESEPEGADFKNRRGFFIVSTLVVGILFLSAVVISIYAEDFGLGNDRIELEAMLAPVDMAAAEPEPPKPHARAASTREQTDVPSRRDNIARTDEPTLIPISTSTSQNTSLSRPNGPYIVSLTDSEPGTPGGSGRDPSSNTSPGGDQLTTTPSVADKDPIPDPPKAKDIPPVRKSPIPSLGVINGIASYLPKPQYPAVALMVNAQGNVDVQVMIDETGRVVSAKAVSGHPLLRNVAEQAARNAKFTPTYLSKVAVKVTGVIVYNFKR